MVPIICHDSHHFLFQEGGGGIVVAMVSVSASLVAGSQGLGCLGPSFHVYTVGDGVSIQQQSRGGDALRARYRGGVIPPVRSHLWGVMDFPLALLPGLSGEKAGLIR